MVDEVGRQRGEVLRRRLQLLDVGSAARVNGRIWSRMIGVVSRRNGRVCTQRRAERARARAQRLQRRAERVAPAWSSLRSADWVSVSVGGSCAQRGLDVRVLVGEGAKDGVGGVDELGRAGRPCRPARRPAAGSCGRCDGCWPAAP